MGLDTVELVMAIEERFDIELPDEETGQTVTLDSLCRLVRQKCVYTQGLSAPSYPDIQAFVAALLQTEFSVSPDKIYPESRFVQDMRLD